MLSGLTGLPGKTLVFL
jgi:hypothetical protein